MVPAIDSDWTRDPFGGDLHDGYIWGRGTVDMKGPVAITLAALQRLSRRGGQPPRRDVVLAFFADEEAGGALGAGYVTQSSPELFADCAEAIGEVGGFSHTLTTDHRGYFVSTAEKGVWWARLRASGVAGHGSMINPDNSINTLAQALVRLADLTAPAPIRTTATDSLIERLREVLAEPVVDDDLLACLGHFDRMIRAGRHNTINATQVSGGYKTNVVPAEASATIDARFLPGHDCSFQRQLTEIIGPAVALETLYHGPAVEAAMDTPLLGAIAEALRGSDPMATVLPYMSTAFTDAKWLHRLGIQCYGFTPPMRLPDDLDFTALFHGANERVPVDSLRFGLMCSADC